MNKASLTLTILVAAAFLPACAPIGFGVATTGGVMASDNRTAGSFIEDERIEITSMVDLRNEVGEWARFSVVSMNRIALVVGQAPNEETRAKMGEIVKNQENVRRVVNQVKIAPRLSLLQQSKDAWITTKVKSALLQIQAPGFSSLDVKVLTEDEVVYLLGLVTKENAALAIEAARNISGVKQVVQTFEFVEPGPAPVKTAN